MLILLVGILVVSAYGFQAASSHRESPVAARTPPKVQLTFEPVMVGEIIDNEGTRQGFRTFGTTEAKVAFTTFKASDGEKLTVQHGIFDSSEEAKRYFDWMVANSSKILKQDQKLDKSGRPVGWRAEVLLAPGVLGSTSSAVMWTDEKHFRVIFSGVLSDALELEKRYGH